MKKLIYLPVVLILFFAGCQKENTITDPVSSNTTTATEKPNWQKAAERQGLNLIQLPQQQAENSLEKIVTCTKYATVKSGAYLSLNYASFTLKGLTAVTVSLNVLPNALSKDQSLTMSFDGEYMMTDVDLTFGPHGTQFLKPALLNVKAVGLDLSALPSNTTLGKLWYFNETTNTWEPIKSDAVLINVKFGTLICINGYLPHFSRYGFTTKNATDCITDSTVIIGAPSETN